MRRSLVDTSLEGVRAARSQGPLRPGTLGPAFRVHGHRLRLRGARVSRPAARTGLGVASRAGLQGARAPGGPPPLLAGSRLTRGAGDRLSRAVRRRAHPAAIPPVSVGGLAVRRQVAVGQVDDRVVAVGEEHHLDRAAPGRHYGVPGIPQVKTTRRGVRPRRSSRGRRSRRSRLRTSHPAGRRGRRAPRSR